MSDSAQNKAYGIEAIISILYNDEIDRNFVGQKQLNGFIRGGLFSAALELAASIQKNENKSVETSPSVWEKDSEDGEDLH